MRHVRLSDPHAILGHHAIAARRASGCGTTRSNKRSAIGDWLRQQQKKRHSVLGEGKSNNYCKLLATRLKQTSFRASSRWFCLLRPRSLEAGSSARRCDVHKTLCFSGASAPEVNFSCLGLKGQQKKTMVPRSVTAGEPPLPDVDSRPSPKLTSHSGTGRSSGTARYRVRPQPFGVSVLCFHLQFRCDNASRSAAIVIVLR